MNEFPQNPREEMEARLTALLLGELSEAEAAEVRAAIAQDAELAKLHARLELTLGLVREVAASPTEPAIEQAEPLQLSEERREKLLVHFKTVTPEFASQKKRDRFPWIEVAAAVAIVAVMAALLLPAERRFTGGQYEKVQVTAALASDEIVEKGNLDTRSYTKSIQREGREDSAKAVAENLPTTVTVSPSPRRRELRDQEESVARVESEAASADKSGQKRDYYFATGTLREDIKSEATLALKGAAAATEQPPVPPATSGGGGRIAFVNDSAHLFQPSASSADAAKREPLAQQDRSRSLQEAQQQTRKLDTLSAANGTWSEGGAKTPLSSSTRGVAIELPKIADADGGKPARGSNVDSANVVGYVSKSYMGGLFTMGNNAPKEGTSSAGQSGATTFGRVAPDVVAPSLYSDTTRGGIPERRQIELPAIAQNVQPAKEEKAQVYGYYVGADMFSKAEPAKSGETLERLADKPAQDEWAFKPAPAAQPSSGQTSLTTAAPQKPESASGSSYGFEVNPKPQGLEGRELDREKALAWMSPEGRAAVERAVASAPPEQQAELIKRLALPPKQALVESKLIETAPVPQSVAPAAAAGEYGFRGMAPVVANPEGTFSGSAVTGATPAPNTSVGYSYSGKYYSGIPASGAETDGNKGALVRGFYDDDVALRRGDDNGRGAAPVVAPTAGLPIAAYRANEPVDSAGKKSDGLAMVLPPVAPVAEPVPKTEAPQTPVIAAFGDQSQIVVPRVNVAGGRAGGGQGGAALSATNSYDWESAAKEFAKLPTIDGDGVVTWDAPRKDLADLGAAGRSYKSGAGTVVAGEQSGNKTQVAEDAIRLNFETPTETSHRPALATHSAEPAQNLALDETRGRDAEVLIKQNRGEIPVLVDTPVVGNTFQFKMAKEAEDRRKTGAASASAVPDNATHYAVITNAMETAYTTNSLDRFTDLNRNGRYDKGSLWPDLSEQKLEQQIALEKQKVELLRKKLYVSDYDAMGTAPTPGLDADVQRRLQSAALMYETRLAEQKQQLENFTKLTPAQRRDALQVVAPPDTELSTLLGEFNASASQVVKYSRDFGTNSSNPKYVEAKALYEEAQKKVDARVEGMMTGLADKVSKLETARDTIKENLERAKNTDVAKIEQTRPYYEAKAKLEDLENFRKILNLKISSEQIDTSLPRSMMVEIADRAVPDTNGPSLWQRAGRMLGAEPQSTARARVKVERDSTDIPSLTGAQQAGLYDPYFIQTESEVIQSEAVLGKVVDRLDLEKTWAKQSGEPLKKTDAMMILRGKLDLKPVKGTSLIDIAAKDENPEQAAKLANVVAEVYKEHRREKGLQMLTGGIEVLKEQFTAQDEEIRKAKAEVERLRKELNIPEAAPVEAKPVVEVEPPPIRKPATNAPIPQPEMQVRENAFSTFSLNVSDVSFKLAAASLEKGQMPDAAGIRSEEFINAFDYRDPEAAPGTLVAFNYERARYPFAHNRDLLRFSLKTAAVGRQAGRPLNIVLVLDNSGSMERADRVAIIREALHVLAKQLQPQDRLSVITFARTPRLWVDGVAGDKAGAVADQLSELTPQGGTNLEEAMKLAYATAARHYHASGINRVVLLTDGAANLGDVEPESLKKTVEAQRKQGIALDAFGIGWEGFNDDLLEVLSRNGDGRYGFINSPEEAASEFAGQLAGALQVAASDVKVQVEFNPRRANAYRQIGYAKHQLTKQQFRDNTVDAAEIASQEAGNALYTVEVNPAGEGPICTVRVRYKIPGTSDYREQAWDIPYAGNSAPLEQSSAAMRLAATSAAFAEWLVASPFAGEVTPDRLLNYLSGVPETYGVDARPKKLEWMIRQAKSINGK